MSDTVEIVKTLVSPCEKLIDAVTHAIGKAYEPYHVRKMADAKAYEIASIGYALSDSSDIPIIYNNGSLSMDTSDWEAFIKRTQNRLVHQELIKQANIESVIDKAHVCLECSDAVSSDPINPDWMLRFFNSVENISNEELQMVWAKILAGEVKKPGSVSMRALDILKNLSSDEAKLFQKILPLVLSQRKDCFLCSATKLLAKYDVSFHEILLLDECGLVLSSGTGVCLSDPERHNAQVHQIHSLNRVVEFHFTDDIPNIAFSAYPLTKAGCELYKILCNQSNDDFLNDFTQHLRKSVSTKNISMSIYSQDSITH